MFTLESGAARLTVVPEAGGRIVAFSVAGYELLVTPEIDDHNFGCFPMAPWAGRIRHGAFEFEGRSYQLPRNKPPHAIHGTARDHAWDVVSEAASDGVIATELGAPWPFGGRVVQRFALTDDALELRMEVHADDRAMPATCGWHPWWNRLAGPQPLELELRAGASYRKDAEGIPTGELVSLPPHPWDDCFTELDDPAARLHWPGALTLSLATRCPFVVAYDVPEHAICVEPQTGPPDAFTIAPTVLEAGGRLAATAIWQWQLT